MFSKFLHQPKSDLCYTVVESPATGESLSQHTLQPSTKRGLARPFLILAAGVAAISTALMAQLHQASPNTVGDGLVTNGVKEEVLSSLISESKEHPFGPAYEEDAAMLAHRKGGTVKDLRRIAVGVDPHARAVINTCLFRY